MGAMAQIGNDPVKLYGYLIVYPYDLGTFTSAPTTVINSVNKAEEFGYDSWRLPSAEELELVLSSLGKVPGLASDKVYMTDLLKNDGTAKCVRLVTTDRSVKEKMAMKNQPITDLLATMVLVEGGTFMMGSETGDVDEKPAHEVTLSSYYVSKYEVTQALYEAVMGSNPSVFQGFDLPVENVTYDDAVEFCVKLSAMTGKKFTLPTEAQWEFAARSGKKASTTTFSGSDEIGNVAWYYGNSGEKTNSVGKLAANELGIHDMSGNVWEWCLDFYDEYEIAGVEEPHGPLSGSNRVIRGGCWYNFAPFCGTTVRGRCVPTESYNYLGFRVVMLP